MDSKGDTHGFFSFVLHFGFFAPIPDKVSKILGVGFQTQGQLGGGTLGNFFLVACHVIIEITQTKFQRINGHCFVINKRWCYSY